MNLIRQGADVGVKKMIICSSITAVVDANNPLNAFDSNHTYTSEGIKFLSAKYEVN